MLGDRIPAKVLSARLIPRVDIGLRERLKLDKSIQSLGLITCDSDDVGYTALDEATKKADVRVCEPFFVRFGRVATEDQIGEAVGADVACVLLGERPGLVTAESMSAYIAYRPTVGMAESRRTVLANIHRGGTPAVEAGAHIVELIQLILQKKVSGTELPV